MIIKLWLLILVCQIFVAEARDDQRLLGHLRYLSSDELEGRGNGSIGMDKAARYLANEFHRYGLKPVGSQGTFSQPFSIKAGQVLGSDNRLTIQGTLSRSEFSVGEHYLLLTHGSTATVSGDLIFAGFGITAPQLNYDDYADLDVRDCVVLAFEHQPLEGLRNSPFHGHDLSPYASVIHKALNARSRGAVALILIPDYFNHRGSPFPKSTVVKSVEDIGIPTILLTGNLSARLSRVLGQDLFQISSSLQTRLTQSFSLEGVSAQLGVDVVQVSHRVKNIVGCLPGNSDEVIIIGAHYDHLGLGVDSSLAPYQVGEIHNGADDNASGVAGLLVLAQDLATTRSRRTLLFAAFAGEELGLLGAQHYIEHPPLPLDLTVAMVNLDMIGRSEGDVLIGGVGTAEEFRELLHRVESRSPLTFRYSRTPRGSSDHLAFASVGVPILFFFSGLHPDYHKPSDDWEKIDIFHTQQIVQVVRQVVDRLSLLESRPKYVDLQNRIPMKRSGPWLGFVPDMSWVLGGVQIEKVFKASPAQEAGLHAGDVVIEFGQQKLSNFQNLQALVRVQKLGDQIRVLVLRKGQLHEVTVCLDVPR